RADFVKLTWRAALRADDAYAIPAKVFYANRSRRYRHIGSEEILWIADLINKLFLNRVLIDAPASVLGLGDDARAVISNFDYWKPDVAVVGNIQPIRADPARHLGAAFDQMPGDRGAGEFFVVISGPLEMRDTRCDREARIGNPAGDDDVCAELERLDDRSSADVRVGGDETVIDFFDRLAGFEMLKATLVALQRSED